MARHELPDRRDHLEYATLASVLAALRAGSWGWGSRGGAALGRFVARAVPLRREVALENLQLAFPELDVSGRRKIYRAMCENYGLLMSSLRIEMGVGGQAPFNEGGCLLNQTTQQLSKPTQPYLLPP